MPSQFDSLNTIADVDALIQGAIHESEVLEYKTASVQFTDGDKKEIAKDISGMANSLGGVIIYGVATGERPKTLPVYIESIDLKNIAIIEQVLNSQVRPPITGIRTKLIPPGSPRVMIVEVPPSENPPHQNLYDKKYYRRSGTECLPMEHDLVAMHFGRRLGPLLFPEFRPLNNPVKFEGEPARSNEAELRVLLRNDGRRIAQHVVMILRFPPRDYVEIATRHGPAIGIDRLHPGQQVRQLEMNTGVIHPQMSISVLEFGFIIAEEWAVGHATEPFIIWSLHASDMSPTEGTVSLRDLTWA